MSTKTFLKLLDFEVRLIRDTAIGNRRLEYGDGDEAGAIRRWFQRRTSNTNTNDESRIEEQRRDAEEIKVNRDALQIVIQDYLMNFLSAELANSQKAVYAMPFAVSLYPRTNRRTRALAYDVDQTLREGDGDLYEGFEEEEEEDLKRIEMKGIFNSNLEGGNGLALELDFADDISLISTTSSLQSHDPTTSTTTTSQHQPHLRQNTNPSRRTELRTYSAKFGGRVAFEIGDEDSSESKTKTTPKPVIPPESFIQAKQAQGLVDEDNKLLELLMDTNPSNGLSSSTNVDISFQTSNPQLTPTYTPPTNDNPTNNERGFDIIIVIAIAVAACSMMLLGFALFLAFRRRKRRRDGQIREIGSPLHEATKKTVSTGSRSPLGNGNSPPVFEIMENDDNVSEYTESVYSMPVALGVGEQQKCSSGRTLEGHCAPARGVERSVGNVSTRFSPRYVGGDAMEERSAESSNDANEMDGIPPSPDSSRYKDDEGNDLLPVVTPDLADKTTTASVLKDSVLGQLGMNADHDALIENDIHSSLEAYGNGDIPDLYDNSQSQDGENHDALSLSSAETYGFSLDGMNSTVANSTKYGY